MAEQAKSRRFDVGLERLSWANRLSLTSRILAVNLLPLALLGGGIFYLDGDVEINNFMMLTGLLIVTGELDVNTSSVIISDSAAAVAGPPAGFNDVTPLRVVEGSWIRVVY